MGYIRNISRSSKGRILSTPGWLYIGHDSACLGQGPVCLAARLPRNPVKSACKNAATHDAGIQLTLSKFPSSVVCHLISK